METVYEKVCPACGRSALLAAKFCSGCGHEYRTVFHDQDTPAAAPVADAGRDAPWIPFVVAIAPVIFVVFLLSATNHAGNTTQVGSVAAGSSAMSTPYASTSYTGALPAAGMSITEVQNLLGQPPRVVHGPAGDASEDWYYTRSDGHTLNVHFNSSGSVASFNIY